MAEKKDAKVVTPVVKEEAKATVKAAEAAATEVTKVVEEKVKEVKAAAVKKATAKKPAEKKTTKKTVAKKASAARIVFEYQNNNVEASAIEEKVKAQFVAEGHRAGTIKKLDIYVKPEDYAVYYVINDKFSGRVDLF